MMTEPTATYTVTPKVDALAALLEYFTEDQLLQLAEKCNRAHYASQGNGQAEVFVFSASLACRPGRRRRSESRKA